MRKDWVQMKELERDVFTWNRRHIGMSNKGIEDKLKVPNDRVVNKSSRAK